MIIELGHFSLILALGLAFSLALVPALGVYQRRVAWMRLSDPLAVGLFVFVLIGFCCLAYAFLTNDFSVIYVANNANTALPLPYKLSAIWGAHEGSLLLWILIMTSWTLAVSIGSQSLALDMKARVLAVMGILTVGFLLFMLLTSNPFARNLPMYPSQGSDLNPLLQDFGLIVHPPMLYMGYVGFSVPFAFAIATLTSGRLDAAWVRWSRPWTNIAWAFLTLGITLGSWWAYYELGWGGWWFWDAVENASFMPWLIGTALIHSLAATEKRGVFKSWTVLLAIFAFAFSLIGAFIVRSGVLTSVHAFAVDPGRGLFILGFLVLVIGGSLFLYAIKASRVNSQVEYGVTSREAFILVNNLLLVVATASILLGTIYPLIYETMTAGAKISIGPPYFNKIFVPIAMLLFLVMALSPKSEWKTTASKRLLGREPALGLAVLLTATGLSFWTTTEKEWWVIGVISIALWILANLIDDWLSKVRHKQHKSVSLLRQRPGYYGMLLAHGGCAIAILGMVITIFFSIEKDVRLAPGDGVELAGYEFRLHSIHKVKGPNYIADQGEIRVQRQGKTLTTLYPEKRLYQPSGNLMTEVAIDAGFLRDLYVALGEPIDGTAWAVRIHYKPLVRWIWLGGLLIALGGVISISDGRYRRRQRAVNHLPAEALTS